MSRVLLQRIVLWLAACAFCFSATAAFARPPETGFLDRSVTVAGVAHRYEVYVPREWNKGQKWPVILFLHGHASEGDDGILQTEIGISGGIRTHADRFPVIVVFPQSKLADAGWMNPENEAVALATLEQSMKEFRGDPTRVYLTGLSMGGYGTWWLGAKYPGKFAAIVPVCGGISLPDRYPDPHETYHSADPYATVAGKIGKTPVWVFHGEADPAVPVSEARHMVEALKAAGGNVRYTEYSGVGHNSWDKAYREPELMKWLLAQRLQ